MSLELPPELEPYRARIEATLKPCVRLVGAPGVAGLRDSKLGGIAYWPAGLEYPLDSKGATLFLLAQLNLDDLPKLTGFPQTGLLQFFVADANDYGANLGAGPNTLGHRVIHHARLLEEADHLETHAPNPDFESLPHDPLRAQRLVGRLESQPKSAAEGDFHEALGFAESISDDLYRLYERRFSGAGHRYGGYPYFTQGDARVDGVERVLLFQLDDDPELGVLWGDSGVGNFFISVLELEQLDFSKVFYSWDCL